eukprot:scaffold244810_cov19-Tisochrysis_lutea.AAC.1
MHRMKQGQGGKYTEWFCTDSAHAKWLLALSDDKDGKPERDPLYEYYGDEDYEQAEEDLLEKFLP